MSAKKYFLLIDDDSQDIEFLREVISGTEYADKVKVIKTSIDYYKYANNLNYDNLPSLIFLDINMPGMNGFEFLQKIRKEKFLEYVPVVMLTTSDNNDDVIKSYSLGANGYIIKPLSLLEFEFTIKKALDFWMNVNVTTN